MPLLKENNYSRDNNDRAACKYCGLPLEPTRQYYFSSAHTINERVLYCNNLVCPGEPRDIE